MKKIFVLILCVMLALTMSVVAYAEEGTESIPVTEGETTEVEPTITETITGWVQENFEEISVVGTLLATIIYEIRKHKKLNGSIGTLNNNAVAVAENSATAIKEALSKADGITEILQGFKDEIAKLLEEIRKTAEEKQSLEETLAHVANYLKTAKLANVEFANELAELLCLANIPNSKKDELYARHTTAVHELEVAEEVMSNDGQET